MEKKKTAGGWAARLLNGTKEAGKGAKKEPFLERNFKNFFKLYSRNLGRMFSINLFYLLGNFPALFLLLVFSGNVNAVSFSPTSSLYPALYGASLIDPAVTPVKAALLGLHGVAQQMQVLTPLSYVFLGLSLLLFVTWGPVNVGTGYILRNIMKGEPVFLWEDFWYAIRRNLRQGLLFGAIDLLILLLLGYDTVFFFNNMTYSFLMSFFFWIAVIVSFLYFVMRFYVYPMMVTFDLSIFKLLKNALYFVFLGAKRNLLALLGILLSVALTFVLFVVFIPLGILLPLVILFGSSAFMACYAAWPKIKRIMIDPYYKEEKKENEEEPVFHDVG